MFSAGGAVEPLQKGIFIHSKLILTLGTFYLIQRSFAAIEIFVVVILIFLFRLKIAEKINLFLYRGQSLIESLINLPQEIYPVTQKRHRIGQLGEKPLFGIGQIQPSLLLKALKISSLFFQVISPLRARGTRRCGYRYESFHLR